MMKENVSNIVQKIHFFFFKQEMSVAMKEFVGDLSFASVMLFASAGMLFVFNIFSARLLGVEEFGNFQMVFVIANVFMAFMLFGINTSSTKYISQSKSVSEKSNITVVASLLFIFFTSIVLVISMVAHDDVSTILKVDSRIMLNAIVLGFALSAFQLVRSFLHGWKRIRHGTILELVSVCMIVVVFIFFIFRYEGLIKYDMLVTAFIIGYGAFVISAFLYNRDIFNVRLRSLHFPKKVIQYAVFAFLGSVSGILLSYTDRLILSAFYDSEVVGLYSLYILSSVIVFSQIISIINTAFFPHMSAARDKRDIIWKLHRISRIGFFISFILAMVSISAVALLAGQAYVLEPAFVLFFALSSAIMISYQVKMWFLNACGVKGVRTTIRGTIIAGLLNLFFGIFLIPLYGIIGAISSTVIANLFLYYYFNHHIKKQKYYDER